MNANLLAMPRSDADIVDALTGVVLDSLPPDPMRKKTRKTAFLPNGDRVVITLAPSTITSRTVARLRAMYWNWRIACAKTDIEHLEQDRREIPKKIAAIDSAIEGMRKLVQQANTEAGERK